MNTIRALAKSDRYKRSSYRAYNYKLPERYDSSLWMKICQISQWDRAIIFELGNKIERLSILDVGCGTGRLLCKLAEAGARNLAGIDLAPRILEVAHQKMMDHGIEADLKEADVEESIPWPDDSFEVATLSGVFHHLYRPLDALSEIKRVLRTSGRIIIVEPWFFTPVRQLVNLLLFIRPHQGDFRFYSPRRVATILTNFGWQAARHRRVGYYSFLASGLKSLGDCP